MTLPPIWLPADSPLGRMFRDLRLESAEEGGASRSVVSESYPPELTGRLETTGDPRDRQGEPAPSAAEDGVRDGAIKRSAGHRSAVGSPVSFRIRTYCVTTYDAEGLAHDEWCDDILPAEAGR